MTSTGLSAFIVEPVGVVGTLPIQSLRVHTPHLHPSTGQRERCCVRRGIADGVTGVAAYGPASRWVLGSSHRISPRVPLQVAACGGGLLMARRRTTSAARVRAV